MKNRLRMWAGSFITWLVQVYFWVYGVIKPLSLWMDIQWQRLWAKFPILRKDIFHSSMTMLAFILLLLGSMNDVRWLTFVGFIALSITLTLGTINIIYNFGEYNG